MVGTGGQKVRLDKLWVNKVIMELQTCLRLIRFGTVNLELLMRYRSVLLMSWFQEEVTALV